MPTAGSPQLVEQHFSILQVGGVEPFGEPAVDGRKEFTSFRSPALFAPQPGKAHRGAQFPKFGSLLLGDDQGFAIQFLSFLGMPPGALTGRGL